MLGKQNVQPCSKILSNGQQGNPSGTGSRFRVRTYDTERERQRVESRMNESPRGDFPAAPRLLSALSDRLWREGFLLRNHSQVAKAHTLFPKSTLELPSGSAG